MCGIAGIVDERPGGRVAREQLVAMNAALAHRGPDGEGYYLQDNVGLAHRRLAVIDLHTGDQPMTNEDGTLHLVFNGEIYNFQSLRESLRQRGHVFATQSDTEVILHAYETYGDRCVEHLRGMFAFALWDAPRKRLLLARDRVGKKPLYYRHEGRYLAFASEAPALLALPETPRALHPPALEDFLALQYVPAPQCIFAGLNQLPPAHVLVFQDGEVTTRRYWDLTFTNDLPDDEPALLEQLLETLRDAVRPRLISDVPLGAFLSGGIDSSLVVALMAECASERVRTFTIGFDESEWSEAAHARRVAQRFDTEHHEYVVRPDALADLPGLVERYGEPFGDPSALPTMALARMAREHVTVALNGDGGDEAFGGYERYLGWLVLRHYKRIPRSLRTGVIGPLLSLLPGGTGYRDQIHRLRLVNSASLESFAGAYGNFLTVFRERGREALYTPAFAEQLGAHRAEQWLLPYLPDNPSRDEAVDAMQRCDLMTYLPGDLLVKVDRATMAVALEGRSPLLDQEVLAFAARLPTRMRVRGRRLKYLLRRLAMRYVPPDLAHRRKQGFGVPVGAWFRGSLRPVLETVFADARLARDGIVRADSLRDLMREHQQTGARHGHRLWTLLNLELWYRRFICREPIDLAPRGPAVDQIR